MSEIRTLDNGKVIFDFKTNALDHSANTPNLLYNYPNILNTEGCNKSNIICGYTPKNNVKNINGNST
jgi:hypothetical protein